MDKDFTRGRLSRCSCIKPERWTDGTFRWLPRPALSLADRRLEKPPPSPVIDAALAAPEIQGALNWMRFPYVEVESTNRGHTVHLLDVRYVRRRTAGFGTAIVKLDAELRVLSAE